MKNMEEVIHQAITRAIAEGYYPAAMLRDTDWETVLMWARRARRDDFVWQAGDGFGVASIIVGPGPDGRTAIHAGQCRILGGLLADNPVPDTCMTRLETPDPTRPWGSPVCAPRLDVLVPMECARGEVTVFAPGVLRPMGLAA